MALRGIGAWILFIIACNAAKFTRTRRSETALSRGLPGDDLPEFFGDPIADGGFGSVWKGSLNGKDVAVKYSDQEDHGARQEINSFIQREAYAYVAIKDSLISAGLPTTNLIDFLGFIVEGPSEDGYQERYHPIEILNDVDFMEDSTVTGIVMEFCDGGDFSYISVDDKPARVKPSLESILEEIYPVIRLINDLHSVGYVHRDIKPGNIMRCPSEAGDIPKLIDFGGVDSKNVEHYVPHKFSSFCSSPSCTPLYSPACGHAAFAMPSKLELGLHTSLAALDRYSLGLSLCEFVQDRTTESELQAFLYPDYHTLHASNFDVTVAEYQPLDASRCCQFASGRDPTTFERSVCDFIENRLVVEFSSLGADVESTSTDPGQHSAELDSAILSEWPTVVMR